MILYVCKAHLTKSPAKCILVTAISVICRFQVNDWHLSK